MNMVDAGRSIVKNNFVHLWSQESLVVTSDYVVGWTVQGLTLGRSKKSFASPNHLDGLWDPPFQWVPLSLAKSKATRAWRRSVISRADYKNEWRYNSILLPLPPYLPEGRGRDNFASFRRRLVEEFQRRSL